MVIKSERKKPKSGTHREDDEPRVQTGMREVAVKHPPHWDGEDDEDVAKEVEEGHRRLCSAR